MRNSIRSAFCVTTAKAETVCAVPEQALAMPPTFCWPPLMPLVRLLPMTVSLQEVRP